jgi:hypothetical protein
MSQSAMAPEKMRTKVNVAASMWVCFSAARQSSELLAKATIANSVRTKIRTLLIEERLPISYSPAMSSALRAVFIAA